MKTGFQIFIQDGLTSEETQAAKQYCADFIINTLKDPKRRYNGRQTNGGRDRTFGRNSIGYKIRDGLFFRRISTKVRSFAVVKEDTMTFTGAYCPCGKHNPDDVQWKNGVPEMTMFALIGEPRG